MLIGLPNAGKSQLLASLTGAPAKVRYTTRLPQPGVLQYQNVQLQLVDTPALNDQDTQTQLFSLLRNSDLLLIVVDLSTDALADAEEVVAELDRWGYLLLEEGQAPDPEEPRMQKRAIFVANKADEDGALDQFQRLETHYGRRFPVVMGSAVEEVGLDEIKEAAFKALGVVRVYTRAPGGDPDYASPIVLALGGNVEDAAQELHRDWRRRLKYALLWGSGKFEGQRVGRDYVLADGDVLEFHG